MRQKLFSILIFSLLFCMLLYPRQVFSGASDGLLLWFQIVLPTLLPFLFISDLMIRTNAIIYISHLLYPVFSKLFSITPNACFAVLSGFLCGYPVGAKTTADLVKKGAITRQEGNYLLSFCNNASPAFIVSYLIAQHLQRRTLIIPTITILLLAPWLTSLLSRIYYKRTDITNEAIPTSSRVHFHFHMIDVSMMNCFETITKIGGYLILFSVLISLLRLTPVPTQLLAMLEITNGIPLLLRTANSFPRAYVEVLALTSFGGFCSIAQTNTMLQDSGLSYITYVIEKLVTSLVTSLLTYLYIILR